MFTFGSGLHDQYAGSSSALVASSAFFSNSLTVPAQNSMPSAPPKASDAPAASAPLAAAESNQISNQSISAVSSIPSDAPSFAIDIAKASNVAIVKAAAATIPRVLPRNQFEFMF
jgi:hypothetical protein